MIHLCGDRYNIGQCHPLFTGLAFTWYLSNRRMNSGYIDQCMCQLPIDVDSYIDVHIQMVRLLSVLRQDSISRDILSVAVGKGKQHRH